MASVDLFVCVEPVLLFSYSLWLCLSLSVHLRNTDYVISMLLYPFNLQPNLCSMTLTCM